MTGKPPTADELRQVREALGVSWAEFAARLNTSPRTLEGWVSHGKKPPGCLGPALKYVTEHAGELPDAD